MEVAKIHQDQLSRIKKNVKNTYEGWKPNCDRFNEFRNFTFNTSLSSDDITMLSALKKPQLEFNINEAFLSRLMGEFAKQEPSISTSSSDESKANPTVVNIVEQHIRHILMDSKNYHAKWEIMKDLYSGGFSVGKLWTDYANPMSFHQVINFDRVYDPCLCGFDLLARHSNKGDGRFCYELFPYESEDFKSQNPHIDLSGITFERLSSDGNFSTYNWSYANGNEKILMVCDYYEKKRRQVKIVKLANGQTMTLKEYEMLVESWNDPLIPFPEIKGKPRLTTLETICRYRCIENKVLEYVETDFTFFPLVFFAGNSILLRQTKSGTAVQEMTRPYIYHAKGVQRLKNFAGISLANELENIVQHKLFVAKEALPKEAGWREAYEDIQSPSNYVFNAFYEEDPDRPIPNPIREVIKTPAPPEIMQSFTASDSLMQNILGSYDASLGINDNQLSGIAIIEGATQSNAAAMPYIVGFLHGLQRVAEIIVDLIPKYYKENDYLPIRDLDGTSSLVKINQDDGVSMFYDTNFLNVKVEAGVSFQIQKSRALQQLIALQKVNPQFAEFMNDKGLSVILDNLEIRGIDQLKMMVKEWQQEKQQQKQMAMQQAQQQIQNNPLVMKNNIEMQKLQQKSSVDNMQFQLDVQELKNAQLKILSDLSIAKENGMTQRMKAEAEKFSKQVDLTLKKRDMAHRHLKEAIHLHHSVKKPTVHVGEI